jgi:hypothetical protein
MDKLRELNLLARVVTEFTNFMGLTGDAAKDMAAYVIGLWREDPSQLAFSAALRAAELPEPLIASLYKTIVALTAPVAAAAPASSARAAAGGGGGGASASNASSHERLPAVQAASCALGEAWRACTFFERAAAGFGNATKCPCPLGEEDDSGASAAPGAAMSASTRSFEILIDHLFIPEPLVPGPRMGAGLRLFLWAASAAARSAPRTRLKSSVRSLGRSAMTYARYPSAFVTGLSTSDSDVRPASCPSGSS